MLSILWLVVGTTNAEIVKEADVEANFETLLYVHTIWRHGDRTPGILLNSEDIVKWPQGIGELTDEGVKQQYRLGKWFRRRYGSWLGEEFDRNAIYIRSSDYNRTIMSAMANMAGLFPPKNGLDTNLNWQPVPIHSMPKTIDKWLYEDIECRKAENELKKQWRTPNADKIRQNFRTLLDFFQVKLNKSEKIELNHVWEIYDNFFCEKCNNVTWPTWLNESIFEQLENLYNQVSKLEFHTEVLRRLRGGTLLKEIFNRLKSKNDGKLGADAKFYAYSAHDATIAALLSTFGVFYEIFPKYATALIIEMHKNSTASPLNATSVIRIFHKNQTDIDQLFELSIPGCSDPCTLDKLYHDLNRYFPNNWDSECENHSISWRIIDENNNVLMLLLLFSTITFASLFISEKLSKRQRRIVRLYEKSAENCDQHAMLINRNDEDDDDF